MSSTTPVPIGIDINVLISTLLGGIIAVSGSLAVAGLYIRNQNKARMIRQFREMIQKDYFDNCINPTLGALAEYGTSTVFALLDSSVWLGRSNKYPEVTSQILEKNLRDISNRPIVLDLKSHNYTYMAKYRSSLQKFGTPLQSAIIRTLQFYSLMVTDGTDYLVLQRSAEDSNVEEVSRSLGALALIIESSLIFFEKRFIDLRDYFLAEKMKSNNDFSKALSEKEYRDFLAFFVQYKDRLTEVMDALQGRGDRKVATISFSKWLSENMENNPLENKKRSKKI